MSGLWTPSNTFLPKPRICIFLYIEKQEVIDL